eukprot:GHVP01027245.1.p1 GENE.GHVP01027245.1~~GHVP01027245.1.p1  ORF type:complete len:117 (+),score=19.55 GHVP01027245.1:156-506(+)
MRGFEENLFPPIEQNSEDLSSAQNQPYKDRKFRLRIKFPFKNPEAPLTEKFSATEFGILVLRVDQEKFPWTFSVINRNKLSQKKVSFSVVVLVHIGQLKIPFQNSLVFLLINSFLS